MMHRAYQLDEVGSGSRGTVRDVWLSLPVQVVRRISIMVRNTTDLSKILPNLLRLLTFGFPLLSDYFRNVRIIETRIASNDGLLVVLSIKDKCYKEVSD
jgi:hypothetical protein